MTALYIWLTFTTATALTVFALALIQEGRTRG